MTNRTTQQAIEKAKALLATEKAGAAWLAMIDIKELINYSAISRKYFKKSANWLLQRLHGNIINGKPATFKPEEYATLASALRDMATKLTHAAEAIDQAN